MFLDRINDLRKPWDKFRRSQLVRILRDNGIDIEESKPATLMRDMLVSEGIDFQKYLHYIDEGPLREKDSRQEVIQTKEGLQADMSFMQFKAFAKKIGVEVDKSDTMDTLNTKLKAFYGNAS